jgi:hypothetical protein
MIWQQDAANAVQAFYAEQSYGRFAVDIDVFGIYRVPLDQTAVHADIAREAKAAAVAAGVDLAPYTHFAFVSPQTDVVRAGRAIGREVFMAGLPDSVTYAHFSHLAHELGHSMLSIWQHAQGTVCEGGWPIGPCVTSQYGDAVDTMGHGDGHFNAVTKRKHGWLDADQVQTVTATGDYVITPLETVGGVKALMVLRDKRFQFYYHLEYRQPIGFDAVQLFAAEDNVFYGALVRFPASEFSTNYDSNLLYMNPSPDAFAKRPALEVGQTFCDKDKRVSIAPLAATPDGLTVRVRFGNCRP